MNNARAELLAWAERGLVPADRMTEAFVAAGVTPPPAEWRAFLDRMLLWLGAAALAAAAVFFVAANWDALGRFAKFALVEAAIVAAVVVTLWRGMDSLAGRAALFAAAMLIGVLLALVGQVYQTGADTYELFAAWALAILAWAVISRQPAVWILWLALINLAVASYYQTFGGFLGAIFSPPAVLGMLFAINSIALIAWETLVARGVVKHDQALAHAHLRQLRCAD